MGNEDNSLVDGTKLEEFGESFKAAADELYATKEEASGGHIILDSDNTQMTQRSKLKFDEFEVEDDSENGVTIVKNKKVTKIYGFIQNFSNLAPASDISYPSTVVNYQYRQMLTNEGTGTVTIGDWGEFLVKILKNKPYMVLGTGEADYQLDPSDYTKKTDGTASDVANTSYSGAGAFAWLNKLYYKEEYASDGNSRTVMFSTTPQTGFDPVGFVDDDSNELEGLWLAMFYQNANNSKTLANQTLAKSLTTDQQKTKIDAVGSRARFLGGPIMNILRDLLYMLFKSTDIQLQAGHGNCNGGSESALKHNPIVANGAVSGWKGTNDKKTANKYFHSMVLGTYDQWLRDPYTQLVSGTIMVSPYYNYSIGGSGYVNTGKTRSTNSAWEYPAKMEKLADAFGSEYKQENTGSTTTGCCDGHYYNASGTRVALRLGGCGDDLIDGPAALYLGDEASSAFWSLGAAVLLLPPAGYSPE